MMREKHQKRMHRPINLSEPTSFNRLLRFGLTPAYLAVLLARAIASPDVPPRTKGLIALAALYTSAGIDLVPENIFGPIGLVDDGFVLLEALHLLLNETQPAVLEDLWPADLITLHRLQTGVLKLRERSHRFALRPIANWFLKLLGRQPHGSTA